MDEHHDPHAGSCQVSLRQCAENRLDVLKMKMLGAVMHTQSQCVWVCVHAYLVHVCVCLHVNVCGCGWVGVCAYVHACGWSIRYVAVVCMW